MAKVEITSRHSLGAKARLSLGAAAELNKLSAASVLIKFEWRDAKGSYELTRSSPKPTSNLLNFDLFVDFDLRSDDLNASIYVLVCDALSREGRTVLGSVSIPASDLYFPNAVNGWFALKPDVVATSLEPSSISVVGRVGTLSEINGKYVLMDEGYASRPAYKHESQAYYLYHHISNPAWMISKSIGAQIAPAYTLSSATTPDKIVEVWSVANVNKFEKDPNIKIIASGTRVAAKDTSRLYSPANVSSQVRSNTQNLEKFVIDSTRKLEQSSPAPNSFGRSATTKVVPGSSHVASPRKASLPVLDDQSVLPNPSNSDLEDESSASDLKIVVKFLEKADSYIGQRPILDNSVDSTFVQVLREEILINGASVYAHDSFEHLLRALKAQPEVAPTLLASEADRIKLFREISLARIRREELVNESARLDQELAVKDRTKDSFALIDLMRKAERQWANYENYRRWQQIKDESSAPVASTSSRNLPAAESDSSFKSFTLPSTSREDAQPSKNFQSQAFTPSRASPNPSSSSHPSDRIATTPMMPAPITSTPIVYDSAPQPPVRDSSVVGTSVRIPKQVFGRSATTPEAPPPRNESAMRPTVTSVLSEPAVATREQPSTEQVLLQARQESMPKQPSATSALNSIPGKASASPNGLTSPMSAAELARSKTPISLKKPRPDVTPRKKSVETSASVTQVPVPSARVLSVLTVSEPQASPSKPSSAHGRLDSDQNPLVSTVLSSSSTTALGSQLSNANTTSLHTAVQDPNVNAKALDVPSSQPYQTEASEHLEEPNTYRIVSHKNAPTKPSRSVKSPRSFSPQASVEEPQTMKLLHPIDDPQSQLSVSASNNTSATDAVSNKSPADTTLDELSLHIEKLESHIRSNFKRRKPGGGSASSMGLSPSGSFHEASPSPSKLSPPLTTHPAETAALASEMAEASSSSVATANVPPLLTSASDPSIVVSVAPQDSHAGTTSMDEVKTEQAVASWIQPGALAYAAIAYSSGRPTGLKFQAGDVLKIIALVDGQRAKVACDGDRSNTSGIVPITALTAIDHDEDIVRTPSPVAPEETGIKRINSVKSDITRNASLTRLRDLADARHKSKTENANQGAESPEQVRFQSMYPYNKDNIHDFNFDAGEILEFVAKVDENWTHVRRSNGSEGMAPNNFMKQIEARALDQATLPAKTIAPGENVKGLHDYAAQDGSGFCFKRGDLMEVMSIVDENWIYVRRLDDATGELGLAPLNYVALN